MDQRPGVVFLGEPASFEVSLVGAKAANLGLLAADFPVPAGFCITADAFARLSGKYDPREELRALVAPAYERLAEGNGRRVAVRSSAVGEDSADASFAGQHDTFLDVQGIDGLVEAVMSCWASLGNERAVAYRKEKGVAAGAMPVLIQRLVPAEASAVAFSADPLTGERGVVRINVARGLGEGLVSGAVTPDVYLVTTEPPGIREKKIAATEPVLDDRTVLEIASLAYSLEGRFERPVDVELAISGGKVHVVQCRPITTLPEAFVVKWPDPSYAKLSWSRDFLHAPDPLPRLSADHFLVTSPASNDSNEHFDAPFTRRGISMNGYIYTTSEIHAFGDAELEAKLTRALEKRRAFGRKLPAFWRDKILPYLREFYAWMEAAPLETATPEQARAIWEECWKRFARSWQLHFYIVGTAYPMLDELASLYEELFPGRNGLEALGLTRGTSNEIQEMQGELHDLADTARRDGEDAPAFRSSFARFLERHGHLGHTHNDVRQPSWGEEPQRVLDEVRKRVGLGGEDPREIRRRALAGTAELEARIRAELADRPAELARFDEVLVAARGVQPFTEGHNYELDRKIQTLMRRFVLRAGARLARAGVIEKAEDVFYLDRFEIAEALADERDRRDTVAEREAELGRQKRMRPPNMIGAPARPLPGQFARNRYFGAPVASIDGGIRGTGASAGVARGTARKVDGPEDFDRVRPGDVLFCHATNPTYVPLFGIIAALVTDVGGELCHAAVVAREFGVPAVVGARDALARVNDGATVEVDGGAGTVRVLPGS